MASSLGPHCPYCGQANRPSAKFCNHCGKPLQAGRTFVYVPLQPGQLLHGGTYCIVRPLSTGGMGKVYLAENLQAFKRLCAVKEMLDYFDPHNPQEVTDATKRFEEEARLLARLKHPSIPEIMTYFSEGGRNYIVMAYIEGENLQERLERSGRQSSRDVKKWGIALCHILEYLASLKPPVVHHDIKPANIILDKSTGAVRLVDFGTAKARLVRQTGGKVGIHQSSVYGTAGYAPPEQYGKGQTDPHSDVYALGSTLYHLLSGDDPGDHPFQFPHLGRLSRNWQKVLSKALEKDVSQRPTAAQLRQLIQGKPTTKRFTFPAGKSARMPEDLVSLSDKHWAKARSYLYAGEFAEWFEALNRSDLADKAEAICQQGGDQDVGLEELLHVLAPKLPQPILRFSTKALDFGTIDPGQQKALNLKLENAGRGCIVITLQPKQAWLKVRPDTVKILAGQSQLVVVELHGGQLTARPQIKGQIDIRDQFNRLDHLEVQATIPLAFRSGEVARTPAKLADLCDKYWAEAREYLYDGLFEQGFRALNRGDMATEAETVRQRGGDQDVGLEEFLQSLVPKLPLPTWQVSPAVLDFGVLTVGSKSLSLTVENSGRGCALVAAQFPLAAFEVQPVVVKLLAGQSQTLKVELDVSQLMARTGMVPQLEFKDQFDRLQPVQIKVRLGLALGSDNVALEPEDLPALCDQHWIEMRRCFQDGSLDRWLEATGHRDLARVALAHQQDADPDRHLDQFLRIIDPTRAPRLISNVTELDFGNISQGQKKTLSLEISNDGNGLLDGRVDCAPTGTWLSAKPTAFRCFPGQKQQIEVTIDTTRLTRQQTHRTRLNIASNGGTLSVPITVVVPAKPPTPMIEPPHLNFGAVALGKEIAPQALNVTNAGDGSLAVVVKANQDWIHVTPEWFRGISGDVVEQIQVSVDAKGLKSRTSYSDYVVVASPGTEMWVPVYVRTLPTRWQMFTARVRTTIQYAALGFLVGLLASLTAWAWGKGLTPFLKQEGTGNILRDLVVTSAVVCALVMSAFAVRATRSVGASFLAGVVGAGLGIGVVLIGLVAGRFPPTEVIIAGAGAGLLVGTARGLTRKL